MGFLRDQSRMILFIMLQVQFPISQFCNVQFSGVVQVFDIHQYTTLLKSYIIKAYQHIVSTGKDLTSEPRCPVAGTIAPQPNALAPGIPVPTTEACIEQIAVFPTRLCYS